MRKLLVAGGLLFAAQNSGHYVFRKWQTSIADLRRSAKGKRLARATGKSVIFLSILRHVLALPGRFAKVR
jgi:hypothetical protein